jgi:hypothetical protein
MRRLKTTAAILCLAVIWLGYSAAVELASRKKKAPAAAESAQAYDSPRASVSSSAGSQKTKRVELPEPPAPPATKAQVELELPPATIAANASPAAPQLPTPLPAAGDLRGIEENHVPFLVASLRNDALPGSAPQGHSRGLGQGFGSLGGGFGGGGAMPPESAAE